MTAEVSRPAAVLICAENVSKSFGATRALRSFNMAVEAGQIHALIGENGAGKSTFIKILAGIYREDSGSITYARNDDSRPVIAFIHQDLGLIPSMTVAENIVLGAGYPKTFGVIDWRRVRKAAKESLTTLGVDIDPRREVSTLSMAERALVAIARALSRNAKLLVLDEPTATLPGSDVELLFAVLRRLKAHGIGLIYVSHRLREVLDIADKVTVVRDGRLHFAGSSQGMSEKDLMNLMSDKHSSPPVPRAIFGTDVVLQLTNVRSNLGLRSANVVVKKGEIVGCIGLRGSGQEMLAQILVGLTPSSGDIKFDGKPYYPKSPSSAMLAGMSYVSGDRNVTNAGGLTLVENLFLNPSRSSLPGFIRPRQREQESAESVIAEYGVRPPVPHALISELSGGNAQKLVVARGFDAKPHLVILEEPTAGVDMPTRNALYALMRRKAEEGVSFLLTSSDHDEVAAISDRIYIFSNGEVCRELKSPPFNAEELAQTVHEIAQ